MGIMWCRRRWYPIWILRLAISMYAQNEGRAGILRYSIGEVKLRRKARTCSLCRIALVAFFTWTGAVTSSYSRLFCRSVSESVRTCICKCGHTCTTMKFRHANMCSCEYTHVFPLQQLRACVRSCTRRCSCSVLALVFCIWVCVLSDFCMWVLYNHSFFLPGVSF